jgi:hypothetical protein
MVSPVCRVFLRNMAINGRVQGRYVFLSSYRVELSQLILAKVMGYMYNVQSYNYNALGIFYQKKP